MQRALTSTSLPTNYSLIMKKEIGSMHSASKAICIRIFLLASPNTELLPVPSEVPLALRTKFS